MFRFGLFWKLNSTPLSALPGAGHLALKWLRLEALGSRVKGVYDLGVSENRGTLFWGPYNRDPTI